LLDLPEPVDLFVDLAAAGNWASMHCIQYISRLQFIFGTSRI